MAGLTEFYCGWNEPSHASQFKWLEYTFNVGETDSLCLFILHVDQNKQRKKGRAMFYVYDPSLWRGRGGGSFHAQGSGKIYASSWQFLPWRGISTFRAPILQPSAFFSLWLVHLLKIIKHFKLRLLQSKVQSLHFKQRSQRLNISGYSFYNSGCIHYILCPLASSSGDFISYCGLYISSCSLFFKLWPLHFT